MKNIIIKMCNLIKGIFTPYVVAANERPFPGTVHGNGSVTFTTEGKVICGVLVAFSNGKIVPCQSGDRPIGIADGNAETGEIAAVNLLGNRTGTIYGLAGDAIDQGDELYAGEDGKLVSEKPENGYSVGIALEDVAADQYVEFVHYAARKVGA